MVQFVNNFYPVGLYSRFRCFGNIALEIVVTFVFKYSSAVQQ